MSEKDSGDQLPPEPNADTRPEEPQPGQQVSHPQQVSREPFGWGERVTYDDGSQVFFPNPFIANVSPTEISGPTVERQSPPEQTGTSGETPKGRSQSQGVGPGRWNEPLPPSQPKPPHPGRSTNWPPASPGANRPPSSPDQPPQPPQGPNGNGGNGNGGPQGPAGGR